MQQYENHYHWLQVKVRKFIAAEKKKEKDEKIRDFILQSPHKKNITSRNKANEGTNSKNNATKTGKKNNFRREASRKNGSRDLESNNQNRNFENLLTKNPFQSVQSTEKKMKV